MKKKLIYKMDLGDVETYKKNTNDILVNDVFDMGNNLPMHVLKYWSDKVIDYNKLLSVYDYITSLYAFEKCDPNHKNNYDETVISILLQLFTFQYNLISGTDIKENFEAETIMFIRRISCWGYDVPLSVDENLSTVHKEVSLMFSEVITGNYTNRKYLSQGGFGSVYLGRDGKKLAVIKKIMNDKNSYDLYKEYNIGKRFEGKDCIVDMLSLQKNGNELEMVMEFAPFTLGNYEEYAIGYSFDFIKPMFIKMLRSSIDKMRIFNEHGFVHLDVKPENIAVLKGGNVKLIDLGLCTYIGLKRKNFSGFRGTISFSSPEWSSEPYLYKTEEIFYDPKYNPICYSTDLFGIVMSFYSVMNNRKEKGFVFQKNHSYQYFSDYNRKTSKIERKIKDLYDSDRDNINSLKGFKNFLIGCTCHNSLLRYTCREALAHPFLGGNGSLEGKVSNAISVVNGIEYTPYEIANKLEALKIYEEFYENYKDEVIPATKIKLKIENVNPLRRNEIRILEDDFTYRINMLILLNKVDESRREIVKLGMNYDVFRFLYGDTGIYSEKPIVLFEESINYKILFIDDIIKAYIIDKISNSAGADYNIISFFSDKIREIFYLLFEYGIKEDITVEAILEGVMEKLIDPEERNSSDWFRQFLDNIFLNYLTN